ncbi:MAG TPA: kynureninase [Candidatus Dormibacteraeota bacterium]|nr:kynureninase [Candidatus Dormibacteraeota bacterium]
MNPSALDAQDPLRGFRDRFQIAPGLIYLDGNSLGPLPLATLKRVNQTVEHEWGVGLIRSWNDAGWISASQRIGDKIARIIGAQPGEVIVCDSTSINLFKLLMAGMALQDRRPVVLTQQGNFPTDLYMAEAVVKILGGGRRVVAVPNDELLSKLDEEVAILYLTQVDYRTGELLDMESLTSAAHAVGALVLWDLCHSAGAVPVNLGAAGADLAVGCTYKYLNGGPGAPAYLFARQDLQPRLENPLPGWMGHASPFAMSPEYVPAEGIRRFLTGTPPIVAMNALECGVDMWLEVDQAALRNKAIGLSDLFVELVSPLLDRFGMEIATPLEPAKRGNQVALRHPEAYRVCRALIDRGVVGDFREPDILRLGFAPLYIRYEDVAKAAAILESVLNDESWRDARYSVRAAVT